MSSIGSLNLPGVKHKVIGLVSGGKDSCFNLMHCVANGHEIVALATLIPEPGVDELDSHLYQSVGTHLLPLIAESMNIPLFTRVIRGKAISQGPEYGSRLNGGEGSGEDGDETEDLTCLLKNVLAAHPDATALSSGAILSTYQRLRIEHVCSRLKLTSLAFLWQSQQSVLLDQMLACGLEPVIMKVAGVGLGSNVVGKQLCEARPLLARLEAQYGSHVAGEGGEYETITLSCPLFSKRIKLTKTRTIITDPEPHTVAYLKVEEAELVEKDGWVPPTVAQLREMLDLDQDSGEEGLDEDGKERLEELGHRNIIHADEGPRLDLLSLEKEKGDDKLQFVKKGRWFSASIHGNTVEDDDVGLELHACLDAISTKLSSENLSLPLHAAHITLLLSDMSLFLPANEAYKTYFGTSPPSRATVAVPLNSGRVRVEVIGFDDTTLDTSARPYGVRSALHVQGLSYWAPANIGPYSQSVLVSSRLHVAGQIPLIPCSLTLPLPPAPPTSPYPHQATLALQHVERIVQALRSKHATGGGWEGWIEGAVGWWAKTTESGDGIDVVRDAWAIWAKTTESERAPTIFVQARELPKGALVEYQVNLNTGRPSSPEEDEDDIEVLYNRSQWEGVLWESCQTVNGQHNRGIAFAKSLDALSSSSGLGNATVSRFLTRSVTVKVYHLVHVSPAELLATFSSLEEGVFTFVPVYSIHDRHGESFSVALDMFCV